MIQLLTQFAASCPGKGPLDFPLWYKYLEGETVNGLCSPKLEGINDIWLVVAAIIEILLRIATIVAIVGVIYGGFTYITSQGEPDKTTKARMAIINAVGGLFISVMASVLIGFVAGSIH